MHHICTMNGNNRIKGSVHKICNRDNNSKLKMRFGTWGEDFWSALFPANKFHKLGDWQASSFSCIRCISFHSGQKFPCCSCGEWSACLQNWYLISDYPSQYLWYHRIQKTILVVLVSFSHLYPFNISHISDCYEKYFGRLESWHGMNGPNECKIFNMWKVFPTTFMALCMRSF